MRAVVLLSCCLALAAGENAFEKHGVVSDVIDAAPAKELEVVYSSGLKVQEGNELTPTQVKEQPSVSWPTEEGALYTLVMTDPDAPSRENPIRREYLHFLVGNVPANDVSKGTVLFEYIGAGPPKGSGLHRYVWLVYKQPGHIDFNQETVTKRSSSNRPSFSIRKFAAEKNLGAPIAGNFFQAQYDDYVPELHKQLGK